MCNRVFVLSNTRKPLMPCTPARARRLLKAGKAAVFRAQPFTIILKYRGDGDVQDVQLKVDPGSKTTGLALVGNFEKQGKTVLWGGNLEHRGHAIKARMERRAMLRRGRRGRKCRYRKARFNNRRRSTGWLPPSLRSRVDNVENWAGKLTHRAPVTGFTIEVVRFDMQKIQNPEVSGVEYQQGTLLGYEIRQYVMHKAGHRCAYCGAKDVPLEVEHIQPRSRGGSNRPSNLTAACNPCNVRKGNRYIDDFLGNKPDVLRRVKAQQKAPLKDAAAVNSTRWAIWNRLQSWGLSMEFGTGGRTKWNRTRQGYGKDHWLDAACAGKSGEAVNLNGAGGFYIKAIGRGMRQVVRTDKFGFPRSAAGNVKRVHGFQTGDRVKLTQLKGKYQGVHVGVLAGIRATGQLDIKATVGKITSKYERFRIIQRGDGYAYS